jgi:hypothetical protein
VKRYSKDHDEHWFLGISAYQWVPVCLLSLPIFLVSWKAGVCAFVVWYAFAWTAWCQWFQGDKR